MNLFTYSFSTISTTLGMEDFEYLALITLKIPKHGVVNFAFFKLLMKNFKGIYVIEKNKFHDNRCYLLELQS